MKLHRTIKTNSDQAVNSSVGMNQILIWEPRWHDRTVLLAERRLLTHNMIVIEHKDFPAPFYLTGERARSFPIEQMKTKRGDTIAVRAVPIAELEKETILT